MWNLLKEYHCFCLTTVILIVASSGQAEESSKDEGWQPIFQKMAEDYVIRSADVSPRTFSLRKKPILRWSQPVRGGDDGAIFAWMDRGRPVAIGTIFAYPNADQSRTVVHEFHSLAREGFEASWRGRSMWHPTSAGIELHEIPDAPVPADTPAARLTQMRALLREFSARSTDLKGRPWELRLLPQPLVRYETADDDVAIDGAVFTFAQGTDPEVLFVIEADRTNKNAIWKFGCGRFSDYRLEVKHKERIVWEVGAPDSGRAGSYFFTSVESRPAPSGAKTLKDRNLPDADQE